MKVQTLNVAAARGALEPTEAKLQAALLERLHARGFIAVRVNSGAFRTTHGHFFRAYIVTGALDESATCWRCARAPAARQSCAFLK